MTKVYYNKKCKRCGSSPIRIKGYTKGNGRGHRRTFEKITTCMTKCGRIDNKDVEEV